MSESGEFGGIERRGYRVRGRVQGVGFRWWTLHTSRRLGVGGYVRNLPDGSVEVQAAGRREALEGLERALHQGPPAAVVRSVESIDADIDAATDEFGIEGW